MGRRAARRLVGLAGIGLRGVLARLFGGESRRVLATVVGVAVAVGFALSVTGVALGLAGQSTVQSEDVDYWVVPERGASPVTVSADGVRLGDAHSAAASIGADDRVEYATPVLLEFVGLENPAAGTGEYVLAVGITPSGEGYEVAGVSSAGMTPGDPFYANGSYDGNRTNEVVLSESAADLLNASVNDSVTLRTRGGAFERLTVVNVTASEGGGMGSVPVALVHLSELQASTGATDGDQANQFLVRTNDPTVRDDLAGRYPETNVVARSDVGVAAGDVGDLPLAVAVAAFVTAVVVGSLAVATTMGLEVTSDRRRLGLLSAVGFSRRSRAVVVLSEVLTVAVLGGVLGVLVGLAGVAATNRFAASYFEGPTVATFDPLLVPYGIGLAVVVGLVASLYPVYLSYRARPAEVLGR